MTDGEWWPADYDGPPLISLDREAANVMGVGLGDTLAVSILGREIETEIASLREVNWDTMGFNYIMVMSPNTLRDAPHTLASTLALDSGDEAELSRAVLGAFPSVSIIEVRGYYRPGDDPARPDGDRDHRGGNGLRHCRDRRAESGRSPPRTRRAVMTALSCAHWEPPGGKSC